MKQSIFSKPVELAGGFTISNDKKAEGGTAHQGDFLPNLCTVQAVFHLVVVGQLLAIALSISDRGLARFDWFDFGLLSIMVQWIILSSAASLCPLRVWFRRQTPELASIVSYSIVIGITLSYTAIGTYIQHGSLINNVDTILSNLVLAAVFAGIVLRYFYLQQQVRNQQEAELQARIEALQSRIRPHFLFNSMNSIASLISFNPDEAERLVEDLSDLFRASLSEPGLIPIAREIEVCKRFCRIEEIRLGDRLKIEWQIDDDLEHVEIPSLLLQPLVENAIYHGVQPLPEGGTVVVSVHINDEYCELEVTNPRGDDKQSSHEGHGVALQNIVNRLEAYFDKNAKLERKTTDNSYSVSVRYPIEEKPSVER